MRGPERQPMIADQRVGQLGERGAADAGPGRETLDIEIGEAHRGGHQRHRPRRIAKHRGHQRLQIVFGVDDVAERRVVDGGGDRLCLANRLAANRARVFQRHRVALLRHDAAALHEALAQPQVAELHRAPQQKILDDAAEADEQHARRGRALQYIVHGGNAAVGVTGGTAEAEQLARAIAIDREPRAGDRARAERILVGRIVRSAEPRTVAFELFNHGQQVVRNGRRLRRLGVSVRPVYGGGVTLGKREERVTQVECGDRQRDNELPVPHPVHRHVDVVAAARRVQAAGHVFVAGLLDQPLDIEEQVFVGAVVEHFADAVEGDAVERVAESPGISARNDAALRQHHQVGVVDRHQR